MAYQRYIAVFEDFKYKNFLPIVYTMPVFMLKQGIMSILDRILKYFNEERVLLLTRDYLANTTQLETGKAVNRLHNGADSDYIIVFINGRIADPEKLFSEIELDKNKEEAVFNKDNLIYLKVSKKRLNVYTDKFNDFFLAEQLVNEISNWNIEKRESDIECIEYPWDIIYGNSSRLIKDYENIIKHGSIRGNVDPGAHLYKDENIYIGENSTVMSGCTIVAEEGPVVVDKSAKIMPNSVVYGPCYIGKRSLIKAGATIYEGTTIGEVCKIGGEVEESIIHSYSNKQHYGFLGHSYIGKWCNLGAGTSNSDLKNNYGNVKMRIGNSVIDTGKIFMGMLMGDHSKTAINTSINTGTVVGVMCNIFVRDFPDKYIPSFSWVGKTVKEYDFDKALQTARRVMARRNRELTDDDIAVLKYVHEHRNE